MEYWAPLFRTWRNLLFPPRHLLMLRLFAWYQISMRLLKTLPNSIVTMLYIGALVGIRGNVYGTFFQAIATGVGVWFVRPSTLPKSTNLFLEQGVRFFAAVPLAYGVSVVGGILSVWILTILAFFLFEVPINRRNFFGFFRYCCTMGIALLPIAGICAFIDYGLFLYFPSKPFCGSIAAAFLPIGMAIIAVPLCVESFHTHRAWYAPL